MIWLGGLIVAAIGFVFGRVFNQSEAILADKRRIYEEVVRTCPAPNETYLASTDEVIKDRLKRMQEVQAPLILYAAPNVMQAFTRYLNAFSIACQELTPNSPALHPRYKDAAKAHNDLVLEMRRDAFAWSAFAYTGKSRLPPITAPQPNSRDGE